MFVWVKYGESRAVKIDASDCTDVDGLIREVKKELANNLKNVDVNDIYLWTPTFRDDGSVVAKAELDPDLPCAELLDREDVKENRPTYPLIVKVNPFVLAGSASLSSISCKSQSSTGRCATGRHVDRPPKSQKKFRRALFERDGCCIATGMQDHGRLKAAHICPLNKCHLFERKHYFSPVNGVLLQDDLEDDYDRHKWYFDEHGKVKVLYERWPYKNVITEVNLATGPYAPSSDLIRLHNQWAVEEAKHHCPNCWKYVGEVNVENHQESSCDAINKFSDDDDQ